MLAEVGADRRLHLVRDLRAEAVEATAAAMDASAAAAGSADAPASAAPAEGAEVEDADTEPSSSDSELPDTTAPAVAKAEERSGAAAAAPQERSAADVDMATDMTEAAVADPSLTVGELVDKTKQKLEYMSAYMEGASRMVGFEGALSSQAGAEHRGSWSTRRSSSRSRRSTLRSVLLRRARPLQAPRPPGVRRLAVMPSWARPKPRRQRTRTIPWRGLPRRKSLRQKSSCPMTGGEPTTASSR